MDTFGDTTCLWHRRLPVNKVQEASVLTQPRFVVCASLVLPAPSGFRLLCFSVTAPAADLLAAYRSPRLPAGLSTDGLCRRAQSACRQETGRASSRVRCDRQSCSIGSKAAVMHSSACVCARALFRTLPPGSHSTQECGQRPQAVYTAWPQCTPLHQDLGSPVLLSCLV